MPYCTVLHTPFSLCFFALAGLIIGSFLNSIIYRYPLRLFYLHRQSAYNFTRLHALRDGAPAPLFFSRSHCPHCKYTLNGIDLIPLLSYLCLKGQCRHCHAKISFQYCLIECIGALLSCVAVARYGLSLHSLLLLGLGYTLIVLAVIDLRHQLLPDKLTLSLITAGLILNTQSLWVTPTLAITGATLGYVLPKGINFIYRCCRKQHGMGQGDFKLLAAMGAWFGSTTMLNIWISATLLATLIEGTRYCLNRSSKPSMCAFGPYLVVATFLSATYGPFLYRLIQIQ